MTAVTDRVAIVGTARDVDVSRLPDGVDYEWWCRWWGISVPFVGLDRGFLRAFIEFCRHFRLWLFLPPRRGCDLSMIRWWHHMVSVSVFGIRRRAAFPSDRCISNRKAEIRTKNVGLASRIDDHLDSCMHPATVLIGRVVGDSIVCGTVWFWLGWKIDLAPAPDGSVQLGLVDQATRFHLVQMTPPRPHFCRRGFLSGSAPTNCCLPTSLAT